MPRSDESAFEAKKGPGPCLTAGRDQVDRHPRFVAYAYVNREHYESVEPLTFPQFRATTPQDVLCNVVADGVVRHRLDPLARLMPRGEFIARDQKTETKKNKGWGQHVEEIRL